MPKGRKKSDIPKRVSIKMIPDIEYQPAMTFEEIADELGITNQAVFDAYTKAIYKLCKLAGVR